MAKKKKPKIEKLDLKKIKPGPIRHETISKELLDTMKVLYNDVGQYISPTLEQWEIGFTRDAHPDREVGIWCRIAMAWHEFHERHTDNKRLDVDQETNLVGVLCAISSGGRSAEDLKVSPSMAKELIDCYLSVGEKRGTDE